jgi:hypothetical protein
MQIEIVGKPAGGRGDETVPLQLLRKELGGGQVVGSLPVTLVGGVSPSMLDGSLYGPFTVGVSAIGSMAYISPSA